MPKAIANAPNLWLGLELYYVAFTHLTTCRNQGYSTEGPISWFSIDEYGRRLGLDEEQLEDLHFHIPKMDSVYLDFKTKKLKAAIAQQGNK